MKRVLMVLTVLLAGATSFAFTEIPADSIAGLKITKGKPCAKGVVFIGGKYVKPPYIVERRGTGIFINGQQATSQLVDWNEFLKTQSGVQITKTEEPAAPVAETPAPAPAPEPEPAPVPTVSSDDGEISLDDLFDDNPKPKAKPVAKKAPVIVRKPIVHKPKVTTTYTLDTDFVPNDTSKALVKKINDERTAINLILVQNGFVCFGDGYSRVDGRDREARILLEKLPQIMKDATSATELTSGIHAAGLSFLPDQCCQDLFANRVDYRALQERLKKIQDDEEWEKLKKTL